MRICNRELSVGCSRPRIIHDAATQGVIFYISSQIPPETVKSLFADDMFYFYDEILDCRLPDTDNKKAVSLCITYGVGLTHKIKIKLK